MFIFSQETKYSEFLWKNLGMPFRVHNCGFFSFARVAVCQGPLHPGEASGTETKHAILLPAPPLILISASFFNRQMWEMCLTGAERLQNGLEGRVV